MCPRKETMNLNFVENLVGLRVYPSAVGSECERDDWKLLNKSMDLRRRTKYQGRRKLFLWWGLVKILVTMVDQGRKIKKKAQAKTP